MNFNAGDRIKLKPMIYDAFLQRYSHLNEIDIANKLFVPLSIDSEGMVTIEVNGIQCLVVETYYDVVSQE